MKTQEEMEQLFPECPEAIANTMEIADKCSIDFEFDNLYMPDYQVPEGHDLSSYLRYLCQKGLAKRYDPITPEIQERLDYELQVIENMDFPGYFLITWDMINFAHEQGISVGPGRGSAAGSIVAYSLGITDIDPLKYDLLFERFLNPERVSPPDIDTDISDVRRGEVVDYLVDKYGEDHVSQIVTFNFMLVKGAVRAVGRVLDLPYAEVDRVVKLMPDDFRIKSIGEAMETSLELKEAYESDPMVKELLDIADKIQGMPSHCGKHAAGVAISQNELITYMPVQKDSKDGSITTQYAKEQVEACGLVKMDLLGLRTLSLIDDAIENIRLSTGQEIDISNIPMDDAKTYQMLSEGDAIAVFQLESDGMRKIMRSLKPERFEDIIALVALYRPGPLGSGMVDDFIDGKHGRKKVKYMHPLLEDILEETYGVILYQEQVMEIVRTLGGFSLGSADMLRRAMGKKKPEIIKKAKDDFVNGCVANGINHKTAEEIFDLLEFFGGYGFNKSHSAAYALVAYRTAWLKANYPAEFMAAMLTSVMGDPDKIAKYIERCREMGMIILPPDINESGEKFNVVGNSIRYSMAAVKNVGREAVQRITAERDLNGEYESLIDLCERIPLNKKMLESLIRCGGLDSLGLRRSSMLASIDKVLELSKQIAADKENDQMSLFDFGLGADNSKPIIEIDQLPEFPVKELLHMEKEMIGFYVSGHPFDIYEKYVEPKVSCKIDQLYDLSPNVEVITAGMISSVSHRITKKGDQMANFYLENRRASIRCTIFPRDYGEYRHMLSDGAIVLIKGKVKADGATAELMVSEIRTPCKLYMRMSTSNDLELHDQLRGCLLTSPGHVPVESYYCDSKLYKAFPGVTGFDLDEKVLSAITDYLGEDNVVIK